MRLLRFCHFEVLIFRVAISRCFIVQSHIIRLLENFIRDSRVIRYGDVGERESCKKLQGDIYFLLFPSSIAIRKP